MVFHMCVCARFLTSLPQSGLQGGVRSSCCCECGHTKRGEWKHSFPLNVKWNTPFLWYRVGISPLPVPHGVTASTHSIMCSESQSTYVGACWDQRCPLEALPQLMGLGTETLTGLPCWEVFSQRKRTPSTSPTQLTQTVTTLAWTGDTPWVNKWGACQSAHRNSSEILVREDLDVLGFGFFQLYCYLYKPGHDKLSHMAMRKKKKNDQFSAGWFLWPHFCRQCVSDVWLGLCERSLRCLAKQSVRIFLYFTVSRGILLH